MQLDGEDATIDQIKALALTNYGHFTSMLVDAGQVRGLSLHMQRLRHDSQQLFGVELDTERVRHYVRRALPDTDSAVVRITVFDPSLDLGTIGHNAQPRVLVTTRPASSGTPGPLRLQAASYRREIPSVKHVGLFGAMNQRRSAQREGFDDVLFLNPDGTISEIATSNIGFVRDGQIIWPRSEYLTGVTMRLLHQEMDEPVVTEALTPSDLSDMEAAFATNAATGVRPVTAVDSIEWPQEHAVVRELGKLYEDIPGEPV